MRDEVTPMVSRNLEYKQVKLIRKLLYTIIILKIVTLQNYVHIRAYSLQNPYCLLLVQDLCKYCFYTQEQNQKLKRKQQQNLHYLEK